jgi:hypothetical protein
MLEIEYLFSVSFPLVGNPSDSCPRFVGDQFGITRKILDKPASGGQARMTEIRNCGRDRKV